MYQKQLKFIFIDLNLQVNKIKTIYNKKRFSKKFKNVQHQVLRALGT